MEDNPFDHLAQTLARGTTRRTLLVLAGLGAGIARGATGSPVAAARRGTSRRRKRRRGAGGGKQPGARPSGGRGGPEPGDCGKLEPCPEDQFSKQSGRRCEDGRCSCGGVCCGQSFACFVDDLLQQEICCFDNGGTDLAEIPVDAEYAVCIADRDVCCTVEECAAATCAGAAQGITPSRYRRNPR